MPNHRTRSLRPAFSLIAAIALGACLGVPLMAQDTGDVRHDIVPARGFQPAHTYALSDIEHLDMASGAVGLHIPLASLPPGAAGFTSGIALVYNSKYFEIFPSGGGTDKQAMYFLTDTSHGGWRFAAGYELELVQIPAPPDGDPCAPNPGDHLMKLKIVLPDASKHTLSLASGTCYDGAIMGTTPRVQTVPETWYTTDGTYLKLVMDIGGEPGAPDNNWPNHTWTLYLPDGSRVKNDVPTGIQTLYDRNNIDDSNNNAITFRHITLNGNPALEIKDQYNRTITQEHRTVDPVTGNPLVHDVITVAGYQGAPLVWTVKWTTVPLSSVPAYICQGGAIQEHCTFPRDIMVVDQIILPNQLFYQFAYTSRFFELSQITLPTTATVAYTYQLDGGSSMPWWYNILSNSAASKTVTFQEQYDGGSTQRTEQWMYSFTPVTSQVTAPDGGISTYSFGEVNPRYAPPKFSGMIYKTVRPKGSILEQVWRENIPFGTPVTDEAVNPWMASEYDTVATSAGTPTKTAIRVLTSDKNGNQTSATEYDWVDYAAITRCGPDQQPCGPAGAVVNRVTTTTYYNPTPDSSNTTEDDADTYHKTNSPRLRNARASIEVQGGGSVKSRTEFTYDDPSTTGNLIQQKSWDSTKGAYSTPLGANSISVTHGYDPYGNRTLTTDAKGYQTRFIFGVTCGAGLYLTQMEQAYQQPAQRTWTYEYDCYTGLPTHASETTDPAKSMDTYTSYDVFGRPTLVREAAGTARERRTSTAYFDSAQSMMTCSDLSAMGDGLLVRVARYDALGRVRLENRFEDATSNLCTAAPLILPAETLGIKLQTRYRTTNPNSYILVSNPFRAATSGAAGGEETMGWTRTTLDSGSRITASETFTGATLPAPWGANSASTGVVATAYDSQKTTVTDQAQKVRGSWRDALGRLTQVDEDSSGLNYTTTYEYNALDNLTKVTQGSQLRSFDYDSLSRLSTATNPESDATSYGYDNNGNVTSRTDARSITMSASYDALNRVWTRGYNDATPAVTYCYDGKTGSACSGSRTAPSIGHLTWVGSSASSSSYSYDDLGFPVGTTQTTGQSYTVSQAYNLAGGLTAQTFPSGRQLSFTYDRAGRLASISGQNPATNYVLNPVSYAPHGGISSMQLGNLLYEHANYNARLQPVNIALGTSGTDSSKLLLTFGYGTTNNNGNVQSQVITAPGLTATQTYAYDGVNRLSTATEAAGWYENFGYDRYGNQWVSATNMALTTLTPTSSSWFNAATNRFVGVGYDFAGNQTAAGGGTFTYDGESRQITATLGPPLYSLFSYIYDGEGRRVKRGYYGNSTVYVYAADGKLAAEYRNGALIKEFIYAGGKLLAVESQNPAGTSYLTADHLGSTRVVTDQSAAVKSRHDYLPFGKEVPLSYSNRASVAGYIPADQERVLQRFTGKELDPETGLEYFGARYFSGRQGRFTTPDWSAEPDPVPYADFSNPQTLNLYSYVGNNPLLRADPDGHCWPPSACAAKLSAYIQNFRQDGLAANSMTSSRAVVFLNTFATGVTADLAEGGADVLRLGNGTASAVENVRQGSYLAAASDLAQDGGRAASVILTVTALGAKANAPRGETLRPGPYAEEPVSASGTKITAAERAEVNERTSRCHTCGTTNPGTKSGNWTVDHQPPTKLAPPEGLYGQCIGCMRVQGGQVRAAQVAGRQYPPRQPPPPIVPQKKPGEN